MNTAKISDLSHNQQVTDLPASSRNNTLGFLTAFLVIGSFYLLQKLAIPLGGKNRVQLFLLMMYAVTFHLVFRKQARIHVARFIIFCSCIAIGSASIILQQTIYSMEFSLPSFALFIVIYIPCVFVIPVKPISFENILRAYIALGLVAAGLVAFNWATQVAKLGLPINLDKFIPESAIFREYVYIQPISWQSVWMKPNAIFFLETSVLSQFISSTLILEVCFFRRKIIIGTLAIALTATFGGTGFLLIVLSLPFMLYYINTGIVLTGLIGAPSLLIVAYVIGLLDNIIRRSGDFERHGSSADDRFIKQVRILTDFFSQDLWYIVFGHGPGSLSIGATSTYFIPIVKSSYEYGIIFSIFYILLTITICFGRGVPLIIGAIGFITLHFLNASFLVPMFIYLPLMMGGGYWLNIK